MKISYNPATRVFSAGVTASVETRAFDEGEKPSFWKRHKGKILAGATMAALGGLGYLNKDKLIDTYENIRYKIFMDEDDFWKEAKNVVFGSWSKDDLEDKADSLSKCVKYVKYHWKDGDGGTAKELLKKGVEKGMDLCESLMNSDLDKSAKDTARTVYYKLKNLVGQL
jgi:hypothetical protein